MLVNRKSTKIVSAFAAGAAGAHRVNLGKQLWAQ